MLQTIVHIFLNFISNTLRFCPYWLCNTMAAILAVIMASAGNSRNQVLTDNINLCKSKINQDKKIFEFNFKTKFLITYYHAISLFDYIASYTMSFKELDNLIEVVGDEYLTQKNSILYFPHFVGLGVGSWYNIRKHNFCLIYSPPKQKIISSWMAKQLDKYAPNRTFYKIKSIIPLARTLQKKGSIQLSTDLDVGERDTIIVPFFDLPTATSPAVPHFAKRFNAKILVGVCVYNTNKNAKARYQMIIEEFIIDNIEIKADEEIQSQLHKWLEGKIREYPLQYWWFHRRFKTANQLGLIKKPNNG